MKPRSKSFLKISELDDQFEHKLDIVNGRLTRKLGTCKVHKISKSYCENGETCANGCLKGGITLNFDFVTKKMLSNEISLGSGHVLNIQTEFEFSPKTKLILPLCSHDTVKEVLNTIIQKFKIINADILLYERELSLTQKEIFYRLLESTESPLNLFISWKLNQERKTFVITDHDPNAKKYEKNSLGELQDKLESLTLEEEQIIDSIQENYAKAKSIITERLSTLKCIKMYEPLTIVKGMGFHGKKSPKNPAK